MASFVDKQYQFAPYVETTPVEEMVKVGMYKQQRYDEGVQKIQGWLDETAALPVLRPADKEYLQSTVNNLNAGVRKIAGADFSNQQLISSVGGAVTSIVKDKYIRAGMAAAANYKNEMEMMEEDRKNGKLNPANEDDFLTNFQKYYTNPNLADKYGNAIQFNASYKPAVDWQKIFKDDLAAAHIDEREWEQEAYTTDAKGNKVINPDILMQKVEKGLLSPKVRSIVQTVFARPEVAQQLGIEGRYKYKGYTPELMIAQQEASYSEVAKQIEELKKTLTAKTRMSTEDATKNTLELTALDNELKKFRENTDKAIGRIRENFDQAKIDAYINDETSRLITDYSWSSISSKAVKSPAAEMALSRANYNLAVKKEIFDEWAARKNIDIAQQKANTDALEATIKMKIATGELNADGSPSVTYFPDTVNPAEVAKLNEQTYDQETAGINTQRLQLEAQLFEGMGYGDLYNKEKGVYKFKFTKENILKRKELLGIFNESYIKANIPSEYRQIASKYFDLSSVVMAREKKAADIREKYAPNPKAFDPILPSLPATMEVGTVDVENLEQVFPGSGVPLKKVQMSKDDVVKYYLTRQKDENGNPAYGTDEIKKYLKQKYRLTENEFNNLGAASGGTIALPEFNKAMSALKSYDATISGYTSKAIADKAEKFREAQEQTGYMHGLLNPKTDADRQKINTIFSGVLAEVIKDKSKTGAYKDAARWLSMKETNASGTRIDNNLYYVYRDNNGNFQAVVRRNNTDGTYVTSPPIQITEDIARQLHVQVDEKREAFLSTFGPFLKINGFAGSTDNLESNFANSTSLLRREVGKYSVGLHIKSFGNDTWQPFVYIADKNGNLIGNGIKVSMEAYKKMDGLSEEQKQKIADMPLLWNSRDVIDKYNALTESYFDLLLKK